MKTRILLAGAVALAFAAGMVALPSLADAAQQFHGGGGHGGGGHGGGGHGGGVTAWAALTTAALTTVADMAAAATTEAATAEVGGGVYYGGGCGPMQVVLGLCGPYGY